MTRGIYKSSFIKVLKTAHLLPKAHLCLFLGLIINDGQDSKSKKECFADVRVLYLLLHLWIITISDLP